MATQQIGINPAQSHARDYSRPLAIVTTLFFMWGFLTCLNDILVPHLKAIFDLSYAKVMLVQFAFFSAYFLSRSHGPGSSTSSVTSAVWSPGF